MNKVRISEQNRFKVKIYLLIIGVVILAWLLNQEQTGKTMTGEEIETESRKPYVQEEPKEEPVLEQQEMAEEVAADLIQDTENIRILLKTDNFSGIKHDTVKVSCDRQMQISVGEQEGYASGTEMSFSWEKDCLIFNGELLPDVPACFSISVDGGWAEDGLTEDKEELPPISVASLQRNHGVPMYEGTLEIWPVEGGFVLVNELSLETYLKYVVPSEMPAGYAQEALKAQAVCARTYAYRHLQAYAYPEYEAHVDDSVIYQVYNNTGTAESTSLAVQQTAGQILTYAGQPITAYYFSTSCGYTGDEEIWWEGDPEATPYLQGRTVNEEHIQLEMSREDVFSDFISQQDDSCYDAEISWYRWETEVDTETLSEHLNQALPARYRANPEAILTEKDGAYESSSIETIGKIQGIEILERNSGGAVQKIRVRGSKETITVETEYNVRALLNAKGEPIFRNDGSVAEGGTILPSAYFVVEPAWDEDGELAGFCFRGGGYGHGVGMSQNGANQMAQQGKTFEEILKFFYQDVNLTVLQAL